jgi:hypothetical protein
VAATAQYLAAKWRQLWRRNMLMALAYVA